MNKRTLQHAPVSISAELAGYQLQQPAGKRRWVTPDLQLISRDEVCLDKYPPYSETMFVHISGLAS